MCSVCQKTLGHALPSSHRQIQMPKSGGWSSELRGRRVDQRQLAAVVVWYMASYPKRTSICVAASAKRLRRQFSSCRPYYSNRGERRETIMVRLSNHHLLRQSSNSKKKRDDADVNSYPSHRDEPRQNEQHIQSQRRPLSVPPRNKCSTCSGSIRPQCITR